MADSNQPPAPLPAGGDMQDLIWKLLDGCASQLEQEQLADCLAASTEDREIYLQCVELHVGLASHFGDLPQSELVEMLKALPTIDVAPAATSAISKAAPLAPLPLGGNALSPT
jgi:hypothetical protein